MFINSLCSNSSSPTEIERCIEEVKQLETKISDLQDAFTLFMLHGDKLWNRKEESTAKIIDINGANKEV